MNAEDSAQTPSVVVRGGTVFDGLGSSGVRADVLVAGGRVREIGRIDVPVAARVIDVDGCFVAPGFIDPHAHSDVAPMLEKGHPFKLGQGVTTEINGNCGMSVAPATPRSVPLLLERSSAELLRGIDLHESSFAEFLERVERARPVTHVAYLVGHGTLRLAANGPDAALSPGSMARMRTLAADAFEAGAIGFSTGLIYAPGSYADRDELVELAHVAARYNALYATHMRDEGAAVIASIEEAAAIAEAGGVRLQISHCKLAGSSNHGRAKELLGAIRRVAERGVDVRGDQYPYTAGSTGITALLPTRALDGGQEHLLGILQDPEQRLALRLEAERGAVGAGLWSACEPAGVFITGHADDAVVGRTLVEIVSVTDEDPFDAACRLILRDPGSSIAIEVMSEDDVREIMADPLVGVGSDNSLPPTAGSSGLPHPRTFGTFPRLLGRYVREEGVLDWPEAIRKSTSLIARHFGLTDRGTLTPGSVADIVVFDPESVGHPGDFTRPDLPVSGIEHVLLEGVPVLTDSDYSGARRGRVLRRRGDRVE